eukprot:m.20586 g.20586  ORF g.20586 m.20586 type:complete len:1458 (+) comp5590_c0_seq1:339-4712(+)
MGCVGSRATKKRPDEPTPVSHPPNFPSQAVFVPKGMRHRPSPLFASQHESPPSDLPLSRADSETSEIFGFGDEQDLRLPSCESKPCPTPSRRSSLEQNRMDTLQSPIVSVVQRAEADALAIGCEINGFLSFRNGFLPMLYPDRTLPERWVAWDQLGSALPDMMSSLTLRNYVEKELPQLSAKQLPARYLHRAAVVLGLAAHGYWYSGPPPKNLPDSLKHPWDEVCRRLNREGTYLSGEEVQLFNFAYAPGWAKRVTFSSVTATPESRVWDSQASEFCIENLSMNQALWGNSAENIFHLAFCEMAKAAAPLLELFAISHDAVMRRDTPNLRSALLDVTRCVDNILKAFMKIRPDGAARLGVDPLVWAKTVAPVGVTFNPGMPSPSGLGTPFFHALDVFLGRAGYDTVLGRDSAKARQFFPKNWLAILDAIAEVDVRGFVARSSDRSLKSAWASAVDAYASWSGLLGKHLQKTYGFLELAFKTGREATLGGFVGGFRDRMWDKVMDMLDASRVERFTAQAIRGFRMHTARQLSADGISIRLLRYVVNGNDGLRWVPGDTVSVLPRNSPASINDLLTVLGANGQERIALSKSWMSYLEAFPSMTGLTSLPLAELAQHAQLTSAPPVVVRMLHKLFPRSASARQAVCGHMVGLAELLANIAIEHGKPLHIEEGGAIAGSSLPTAASLFADLDTSATHSGPLVEDVVSLLLSCGVARASIPKFTTPRIDLASFTDIVFPLLVQRDRKLSFSGVATTRRPSTVADASTASNVIGHILDLLVPLEARQYSVANLSTEHNNGQQVLTLIVSPTKYSTTTPSSTRAAWETQQGRDAIIAAKTVRIWRAKTRGFSSPVAPTAPVSFDWPNLNQKSRMNGVASNYLCNGGEAHFTVTSNPDFRSPRRAKPLLMVAAGSGISPFRGFWQERCDEHRAGRQVGETVLLWAVSQVSDCEFLLNELENVCCCLGESLFSVRVIVSREERQPIFRNGKCSIEHRHKDHLNIVVQRDRQLRTRIHRLLLPTRYEGSDGTAYFCGSASFVKTQLEEFAEVLMDLELLQPSPTTARLFLEDACGKEVGWLMRSLIAEGQVLYEVFDTRQNDIKRQIPISELVLHNDCHNGLHPLMCINGSVYDLRHFVHPGGPLILAAYSGMDATKSWESVRHHRSQSLGSKLTTLFIGELQVPHFPALPILRLSDGNLTDLNGVCDVWKNLLFDVVEIENAVTIEYGLLSKHIAGGSSHASHTDVTPMKLQMVFQAHRRFVLSHIGPIIKVGMSTAVAQMSAVSQASTMSCAKDHLTTPSNEFHSQLLELVKSDHGALFMQALDVLIKKCHPDHGNPTPHKSVLALLQLIARGLQQLDTALIRQWKMTIREVFVHFESISGKHVDLTRLHHVLSNGSFAVVRQLKTYITQCCDVVSPLWNMFPELRAESASEAVAQLLLPTRDRADNHVIVGHHGSPNHPTAAKL